MPLRAGRFRFPGPPRRPSRSGWGPFRGRRAGEPAAGVRAARERGVGRLKPTDERAAHADLADSLSSLGVRGAASRRAARAPPGWPSLARGAAGPTPRRLLAYSPPARRRAAGRANRESRAILAGQRAPPAPPPPLPPRRPAGPQALVLHGWVPVVSAYRRAVVVAADGGGGGGGAVTLRVLRRPPPTGEAAVPRYRHPTTGAWVRVGDEEGGEGAGGDDGAAPDGGGGEDGEGGAADEEVLQRAEMLEARLLRRPAAA